MVGSSTAQSSQVKKGFMEIRIKHI